MSLHNDPLYRRFIQDLDSNTWSLEKSALDFLNYELGRIARGNYKPGLYHDVDKMVVSVVMFWKDIDRIRFRLTLAWTNGLVDTLEHEKIWTERDLIFSDFSLNHHLVDVLKCAVKSFGARCLWTGEIPGTEQLKADYECPCKPCRDYAARLMKQIEEWEPTGRPGDKVITMDGEKHGPDCGGCCEDRVCRRCELFMHYQPVYGGYYYECPGCGDTE